MYDETDVHIIAELTVLRKIHFICWTIVIWSLFAEQIINNLMLLWQSQVLGHSVCCHLESSAQVTVVYQ